MSVGVTIFRWGLKLIDKSKKMPYNANVIKKRDKRKNKIRFDIYGMKPMTKKRKFAVLTTTVLLLLTSLCFLLFSCGESGEESAPPTDSVSICLLPPEEGAPEDFSGLENIGYIAGKLRLRPYFHSQTVGEVDTIVTQDILGYKDYKNGVLIVTSLTVAHSNLAPSRAIQKFFGDGKVVIREAASDDPDDWRGEQTAWSSGDPSEVLAKDAYTQRYGVWGNELSDYVINADSLTACSAPIKGEDGVYTMTAQLDPEASTYYYKNQMRTMGNLKNSPEFQSVELTFRFQEDWTLLSYDIHEKYNTRVSIINAKCDATMTISFSYEESSVNVSAYEEYFKQYATAAAPTQPQPEPERTATDYLAEGFAPLLEGESCLQFTASVGEKTFEGRLAPDLQIEPELRLHGIKLNVLGMDAELADGELFFRYQDLNAKIALSELGILVSEVSAGTLSFDAEALLEEMLEAPIEKADGKAILEAELNISGLPVQVRFVFDDGEQIRLESVEGTLSVGETPISLSAKLAKNEGFAVLNKEESVDIAPYIASIKGLTETQEIDFSAAFTTEVKGRELAARVDGYAVLGEPVEVYIAAEVGSGERTERVEILYKNEDLTLVYGGVQMQVPGREISLLTEELSALLGSDEGVESDALALIASEGLPVEKILQAITVYSQADGEAQKLGAIIRLSELTEIGVSDLNGRVFVADGALCLETDSLSLSEVTFNEVFLSVGATANCETPDYTVLPVCDNVLAFALAGYRQLMQTEYAGLNLSYADEEVGMEVSGRVQFRADEGGARSVINLDAVIVLTSYVTNEAGEQQENGTHFLHITVLEEQVWISYSMKELDAATAVYVTLPVSELFLAGGKLLPILSPLLGISPEEAYYGVIVKIFSGTYAAISTDLVNAMTLEEWLDLIVKTATAEPATLMAKEGGEELLAEQLPMADEGAEPIAFEKDENGDYALKIDVNGVRATVTAMKNAAEEIVAPNLPEGKEYIDISSIATLLTDVANAYAYADDGYALSGTISLSLGGWSLKNVDIQLQIDTREGLVLHAVFVPKSGTVTTLTFQNGYFYITRVVQETKYELFTKYNVTKVEHRAMTAADFSADMMEQIYFILNLSSIEQGIIDAAMENSGGNQQGGQSSYDTGEMLKDYEYTENGDKGSYFVSLSLGAILDDSAFGNLDATIQREKLAGKDAYDLTTIDATLGITVLSCNLSLTHDSAIDATALNLAKIDTHLAELLIGLEYADFESLNGAAAQSMVSKKQETKVKA